ncbi:MAG: TatD family hydrolase [Bacteroidia bacterium]|nr:MAG: TatD family hydrolase [Bacteroidia bacterium]
MYINVFTKNSFQEASIEVVNIPIDTIQKPLLYSTGIHPWYIDKENYNKSVELFFINASEKSCLAIGECGLDKSFEINYPEQEKIFTQQVKTAQLLNKPLILYCHKAWKEIIDILTQQKFKHPVIIPSDYLPDNLKNINGIKDYYIAFDKSIVLGNENILLHLKNTSAKRILFYNNDETISIKDVYNAASQILKIDINTLQHQILENFYRAFMLEKLPV